MKGMIDKTDLKCEIHSVDQHNLLCVSFGNKETSYTCYCILTKLSIVKIKFDIIATCGIFIETNKGKSCLVLIQRHDEPFSCFLSVKAQGRASPSLIFGTFNHSAGPNEY